MGRVYATIGRPKNTLCCLDAAGRKLWDRPLEGEPTCAPLISCADDETGFRVFTGTRRGRIECWDAQGGRSLGALDTEARQPIRDLLRQDLHPSNGTELLAADATGVYCFSRGRKRLWHATLPGARCLAVQTLEGTPCIVVACDTGVLAGLSGLGERRWTDTRAAGAVAGVPVVMDLDSDRRVECLYAAADRVLRVLDLGPFKAPAAPREDAPPPVNVIEAEPKAKPEGEAK